MNLKALWQNFKDSRLNQKLNRWKKILLLVPLFLAIFYGALWYRTMLTPVKPGEKGSVSFDVEKGMTAKAVARNLENRGLIRNSLAFYIYVKVNGLDTKFKSGIYELSPAMSLQDIVRKLVKGEVAFEKVTIPEGITIEKIAEIFEARKLTTKEEFLKSAVPSNFRDKYPFLKILPPGATLEGFLYPDTYYLAKNSPASYYVDSMLKRFYDVYFNSDEFLKREKDLGLSTYQVITLASIIEKEAKLNTEKPIIAAVFLNRLKKGIPLQSCATVEYALKEHKEVLTLEDLKIQSPYNTYINAGLPPGPISAPGIDSIKAALNPAPVDYLYFVANGDGTHTFSRTYEEHLKAKSKNSRAR
ncbi:UPF0755 protein [Thermosediminibacter litoriperuensis]|uniref:Endolytic murein transglycosylase n=1 Tax=Thermosediminibacter litoriperuensis TaxID=291989 RepID=A0A5S5AM23_9FIRM|nr:UPF0755 protein [Thermosediminibacter litoriperuensis]